MGNHGAAVDRPSRNFVLSVAAAGAAIVMGAAACAAAIGGWEGGVAFQPAETHAPAEEFARVIGGHAAGALRFFAADTLLGLGYLAVFLGLHAASAASAPRTARLGLLCGAVMVTADLWENAFYVKHAVAALGGRAGSSPDLPLLYAVTDVKEGAVWIAALLFGLALPPRGRLAGAVRTLLVLVPIIGVASLFVPALIRARGWTVILPAPFLMVWFLRQVRGQRAGTPDSAPPSTGS
jgi:hypothetical protein